MARIALVRCVLMLRCGLAVVVWYPYAGFSLCNVYKRPHRLCALYHTLGTGALSALQEGLEASQSPCPVRRLRIKTTYLHSFL